jgi:RNA polymerase sigma factor (sigma-70 family)
MTAPQLAPALRHVRQLLAQADATGLSDAQLLRRFVAQRDEAAFEVLVWRHGPMALGVCRRILRNPHDAEDAFQAALLALARKAPSITRGGSVGCWLFRVARRVALRARAQVLRRARRETQAELTAAPDPRAADPDRYELGPVLDEELARLPEKYRAPVVLCYLEGRTNEEAARHLRCPVGTVKTRLARARELLGSRLTRRGLVPGAGVLAGGAFVPAAALPARLVSPAVRAAALVVSGQGTAAGLVPARVALLTEGVLRAMTIAKLRLLTAALAAALVVAGTGVVSYRALRAEPAPAGPADAAARVEQIKSRIADLQEQLR